MAEDQPSFMIFKEKLTRLPDQTAVFDRDDPDSYPITRLLRLENDRSLFSAVRLHAGIGDAQGKIEPLLDYVTQQISRFNKFRIDPAVLATPSRLPDLGSEAEPAVAPRLGYHGEDLAATLYYLAETESPVLETIRSKIREVVPEFVDFDF